MAFPLCNVIVRQSRGWPGKAAYASAEASTLLLG